MFTVVTYRFQVVAFRSARPSAIIWALSALFLALAALGAPAAVLADGGPLLASVPAAEGQSVGTGDGQIHVIPSLNPYSVKNGEKLELKALVKSQYPISSVVADLGGMARVDLMPDARTGGSGALPSGGHAGIYAAEWTGAGLEERVYAVTLTVTDILGRSFTDTSLSFSDPAAGNSTPGTTAYPNGGMTHSGTLDLNYEGELAAAVIDAENGYAYFGTRTVPGQVVKVALGDGSTPPVRVGSVRLNADENYLQTALIDAANGYAYFGTGLLSLWTDETPARVVKVALGRGSDPPTRVGAVTLNSGERNIWAAVIDAAGGHAYFGTHSTSRQVVKVALGIGSNPPTRVGAAWLSSGEEKLQCAAIDPLGGHAYFGTWSSPGRIVKVALGSGSNPPVRVGAIALNSGEDYLNCAAIDVVGGHAYFGTDTSPGQVVKVALGIGSELPSRLGAVTLDEGESFLKCAVIDVAGGHAYFATAASAGHQVVKVALGNGVEAPSRVGAATLSIGGHYPSSAVIDSPSGFAYFGTAGQPGQVVKVALGNGGNPPARVAAASLNGGDLGITCGVIDSANGYAYFGGQQVVKVALGSGGTPPTRVGEALLESGDNNLTSAVIDTAGGYAYFSTYTFPGRIVKVALGNGNDPPVRVGAVTLNTNEDALGNGVIDVQAGYAYFTTGSIAGTVVKVALGIGADPPTRVGAVTLPWGDDYLQCGLIDPAGGHAYFSSGRVIKVALGSGNNPPFRVGTAASPLRDNIVSAVIDADSGYAYYGIRTPPGKVMKLALGSGSDLPSKVNYTWLPRDEIPSSGAVIDVARGHAYLCAGDLSKRLVKVALGSGNNPPTRIGSLALNNDEGYFRIPLIDANDGYAYFGSTYSPPRVLKVALHQRDRLKGTRFTLPEPAVVTDMRFYSHAAEGNVRLALYDDSEPKNLLWQSGAVANPAANAFMAAPITSGTPSSLTLPIGTYWAAWQVDSAADVPSYAAGSAGDGFTFSQEFGAAPATLASGQIASTAERWTQYITYESATAVPDWARLD